MRNVSSGLAIIAVLLAAAPAGVGMAAEGTRAVDSDKSGHRAQKHERGSSFGHKRLQRLDTDRNGAVSKAEFLASRAAEFKELDVNRDAAVDESEVLASLTEPAQFRTKRFLKRVDANRDGEVTREEYEQGPRGTFAGRDINNDGKLDASDRPPSSGSGFGWFGGGHSSKMGLGSGRGKRSDVTLDSVVAKAKAEFDKIDANASGVLERSELAGQTSERVQFSKTRLMHGADQNKDGKLTEEEFSAKAVKRFTNLDLNDDAQIDAADFPSSARKGWLSR